MDRVTRAILIVDDNVEDRQRIKHLLKGQPRDYTVLEAGTGRDGLARLRAAPLDCVVLSDTLPDMSWSEFLDALSWNGRDQLPLPVTLTTAEQLHDVATEALERGAQDYLVMSGLTGPTLVQSIENSIQKYRIQQDLLQSRSALAARNEKLELMHEQLQSKMLELAEATATKDKFMAVMSHEMRTPLNAIIGYSDLLDMGVDGDLTPAQAAHVHRIQLVSKHLLDLVNDVLDIARADAHQLELELRSVDAYAVVEEVAAILDVQAHRKGLTLVVESLEAELPPVLVDLARLRQILTNLIGNAIKFTETGGVRIHCEADGSGHVQIQITDTGIGIDAGMTSLVFNEFFQVSGELTRERGGSGLGLAISRRMARLMNGDVRVHSTLGVGSTFTLVLPVATASGATGHDAPLVTEVVQPGGADSAAAIAHARGPAVEQVVVVAYGERASALAELERRVSTGVRLAWTTNPDDVVDLAVRERAALVVLDIGSAESAAWRVAGALQDAPELADTAILLLPSIPDVEPEQETEGLDLGWLSLVPKPFTAAQLTSAVSTAARGPDQDGAGTPDHQQYEVLVVDDDADSRRVAARFLTEARLHVREAVDGESALAEMRRQRPDVVVLDLMMPVLDGFGVLATMRAEPALAGLPVVVLTAKSLTDAERRFLSRTTVRILQKGEHRLGDVAALVLRAAERTRQATVG